MKALGANLPYCLALQGGPLLFGPPEDREKVMAGFSLFKILYFNLPNPKRKMVSRKKEQSGIPRAVRLGRRKGKKDDPAHGGTESGLDDVPF